MVFSIVCYLSVLKEMIERLGYVFGSFDLLGDKSGDKSLLCLNLIKFFCLELRL